MKKRIIYIDVLNIIACICVVAMHCNGIVHTFSYDRAWKTSLIVETVAYWAVPIFFMITGATLLDYTKKYSTRVYMKKRVLKTFVPFILWSFLFLIVRVRDGVFSMADLTPRNLITMVFNTQINNVYWFFPALFTVYLGIPVFAYLKDEAKDKIINYVIVYGIFMIALLPCLCPLLGIQFNGELRPGICGGYMFLTLIGYRLSKTELSKKVRYVIYICGIGGWLIRFVSTLIISQRIGDIYRDLWGYFNFPSVMLSVAVFVWFQYHDWHLIEKHEGVQKLISTVSGCSFGVYLIHYYFVWKMPGILGLSTASWQWRTLGIFVVYFVSLAIVWIIKKIPGIKYLVP